MGEGGTWKQPPRPSGCTVGRSWWRLILIDGSRWVISSKDLPRRFWSFLLKNSVISKVEFLMHHGNLSWRTSAAHWVCSRSWHHSQTRSITAQNTHIYVGRFIARLDYLQMSRQYSRCINGRRISGGRSRTIFQSILPTGHALGIKQGNHLLLGWKDFPTAQWQWPDLSSRHRSYRFFQIQLSLSKWMSSQDLSGTFWRSSTPGTDVRRLARRDGSVDGEWRSEETRNRELRKAKVNKLE